MADSTTYDSNNSNTLSVLNPNTTCFFGESSSTLVGDSSSNPKDESSTNLIGKSSNTHDESLSKTVDESSSLTNSDNKSETNLPTITKASDELFNSFYSEVKEIEKRDSVLTPQQQLDRLTRPGATYFNLNPFEVLQIDPETPLVEIKQKYRRMSILIHPDKNPDDIERAQKSFDAMNKAYKTLENEEGYRRCQEIVTEAKRVVDEKRLNRKKQLKKEGKSQEVPEDNPDQYKHAVYVQTCKLFADLERLRQDQEMKEMHEKKRKAQEEEQEIEMKKEKAVWDKNFEESRAGRVNSWQNWKSGTSKKVKKFKPPKTRMEQR